VSAAGDKLYTANSGGMSYPTYNNTVSVISTDSFTEISTIEVNSNPAMMAASSDGKHVFVSSYGNYADQPAKLQMITTSDSSVTDLDYQSVSAIAKGKNDTLYILCGGYDENWNPLPGTIYMHDMKTNSPLGVFVTDGTTLPDAYSISAAADGYIYVGCSDYKTTGDVYVFDKNGRLHDRFDSQGLNPIKAY
jgi:DNA-binding beta-propeller fold protein YncE